MKLQHILYVSVLSLAVAGAFTACTDDVKVGDSFVEKAPGGTVTIDTVFNSAEYTRQFLTGIYGMQYYGLPFTGQSAAPTSVNAYQGKLDALTDCYQVHWSGFAIYNNYYTNTLSANQDALIAFINDRVWAAVRQAYLLIENIDRVPDLSETEKENMVAQAKCLIAARYFDLFSVYGGLPIATQAYTGLEGDYSFMKRSSIEETVDFMVGLLDEAIPHLRWAWDGTTTADDAYNNTGRWTAAGARALKAKILLFAASPLYNADQGYYGGTSQAEQDKVVWYGNFDQQRWVRAEQACREFFAANGESDPTSLSLGTGGTFYQLNQATENSADAYRQAYRMGYIYQGSKEVIHSTRVNTVYGSQGTYSWWNWAMPTNGINRNCYNPTVEYMEMFPWANGEPFVFGEAPKYAIVNNSLKRVSPEGQIFFSPKIKSGRTTLQKYPIRDPRLYENAIVNGQQITLDWTTGKASGDIYELWIGGEHAKYTIANKEGEIVEQLATGFATGFGTMKYVLGEEYHRKFIHWVYLSYDEMLLMWAEALAQTGNVDGALNCVNRVRARVGLGNLEQYTPAVKTDKTLLINEILRERACELGMSNNRYYDMIRYKRTDWMTRELHGLKITRLQNVMGDWIENYNPYLGTDKDNGVEEPYYFKYEKFTLQNRRRVMWDLDPNSTEVKKWLLFPLPVTEINKGYGLVQNPGWE